MNCGGDITEIMLKRHKITIKQIPFLALEVYRFMYTTRANWHRQFERIFEIPTA